MCHHNRCEMCDKDMDDLCDFCKADIEERIQQVREGKVISKQRGSPRFAEC